MSDGPRILILGADGQLGTELQGSFGDNDSVMAVGRRVVDLALTDPLRDIVRGVQPEVIVNAAAYTAVDRAESEPDVAMAVNGRAPGILAEEARKARALFVHYSTDYVFDGSKAAPWTEQDPTAPLNVYGASKLAGEEAIQQVGGRYLIFRTSWVYGAHGKNFLSTMLRLGRERDRLSVVNDQFGAPTTSIDLARATKIIVDGILEERFGPTEQFAGVYHMSCSGSTTWYEFAQAIFARAGRLLDGRTPNVVPIPSGEYPTPAKRPRNSVLSNARLRKRFGVRLQPWESALDEVMQQLSRREAYG